MARVFVGDAAIPHTLDEFLAELSMELKRAGFRQLVPELPKNKDLTESSSRGLLKRAYQSIAPMIKLKR